MQQYQLIQNKQDLRKFCREKRHSLFKSGKLEEISKNIVSEIVNSDFFKNAQHVMLYMAKEEEINLDKLFDNDRFFYLPRCSGNEIEVCPYKKGDILKKSNFGVFEPLSLKITNTDILDLIIVPALCADKSGARLGYGGGFYDRFLENNKNAKKIVVVCSELFFEKIPSEEHDIKCDFVICG